MKKQRGIGISWLLVVWLSARTLPAAWSEPAPGVINPDEMHAAARNTYTNEAYGFSVMKTDDWVMGTTEKDSSLKGDLFPQLNPQSLLFKTGTLIAQFPPNTPGILINPASQDLFAP